MLDEEKNQENKGPESQPERDSYETPLSASLGELITDAPSPDDESTSTLPPKDRIDLEELRAAAVAVRTEIGKLIVGQREFIDLLIASLLAGGHVLVEGVPGIAKTLTAKLLAKTVQADYARIQFTPDLMPSDVTGTTVFNMAKSSFEFTKGPIFSNIVLIDEINRAPAKTQAALFEVMAEQQITVDGHTYTMEDPFFVIATQNPIEQEGTYRLPEAQLDRFLVRIIIDYPNHEEEKEILYRFRGDFRQVQQAEVHPVFSREQIAHYGRLIEKVIIRDELLDYIASIVHRTRTHPDLYLGASPRASLAILRLAKAVAALAGRDFVTPDDIQQVAYPVLNHRIILTPEREMEGFGAKDVIQEILRGIEVPR
ncbi:MoxR family ATPase [Neolewinella lacunae]|uniref:MoxR family ATPase n=1 Tax=Neolewinella lacunae TaxID=1517758 RepID=A0A923PHX2_9BACT|nr:MoxR family ATPase [Neolewinella lacunae]MBC6994395.1 MoxR family ATPase [Neolewinella lacunae]MDN3633326.1 MoxR family ATPase [Neolewinella lacunae]